MKHQNGVFKHAVSKNGGGGVTYITTFKNFDQIEIFFFQNHAFIS